MGFCKNRMSLGLHMAGWAGWPGESVDTRPDSQYNERAEQTAAQICLSFDQIFLFIRGDAKHGIAGY